MDGDAKKSGSYLVLSVLGFFFCGFLVGVSMDGQMNMGRGLLFIASLIGMLVSALSILGFFFQFSSDFFNIAVEELFALVGAVVTGAVGYFLFNYKWWPVTDLIVNGLGLVFMIISFGLVWVLFDLLQRKISTRKSRMSDAEDRIRKINEETRRIQKGQ